VKALDARGWGGHRLSGKVIIIIITTTTTTTTTSSTLFHTDTNLQKSLKSDTKQIKTTIARNLKERWEAKRLRGQFPRSLDEGLIYKEQYYRWLKFGDIKGETESVIMAAQDQAINTNYFKNKV
jgi:hypothetical protein